MHKARASIAYILSFSGLFSLSLSAQELGPLEAQVLGTSPSGVPLKKLPVKKVRKKRRRVYIPRGQEIRDGRSYEQQSNARDLGFLSEENNVDKEALKRVDEFISGPRQIPFRHILVVKPRYINKAGRHELNPFLIALQPGDSFRKQLSMGFGYTYHFTENWAWEVVHGLLNSNIHTGFEEDLREEAGLEIDRLEPRFSLGTALQWSPFKAKSATRENIYHFEGNLFLGGGMTQFEKGENSGMLMYGLGARLFINRFAALKIDVRNYHDFLEESDEMRLNVLMGASIFLGGKQ